MAIFRCGGKGREEREGTGMTARAGRRRVVAAAVGLLVLGAWSAPAGAQERAYELVSPSGVDAHVRFGNGVATPDGNTACYHSERAYLGAFSAGLVTADIGYCARRTPTGWVSEWVTAPGPERDILGGTGSQIYFVSPDGARVVFASQNGIRDDWMPELGRAGSGPVSAYMREGGRTRWLAPTTSPPQPEGIPNQGLTGDREPLAVSTDLRFGVFNTILGLVPEDTNGAPDVYAWTPDGLRLVSADASGRAVGGYPPLPFGGTWKQALPGTMSRDGSRVFFEHDGALAGSPDGVRSVFLRDGDDLVHVSPRRGPGPAADVTFAGATPDGRVVYLQTAEQLTDEPKLAGDALYRYDIESDRLSLVATDPAGILFLGVSDNDATIVYSVRDGPLPPVYVRHQGVVRMLGTAMRVLDGLDVQIFWGGVVSPRPDKRGLRISPDGRAVVFASAGAFDGTLPGTTRVYRWDAERGVRVISVDADGRPVTRDARIGNYSHPNPVDPVRQSIFLITMRNNPNVGRVITDDGSTVFFETGQRLVDEDVNDAIDVYEWRDGRVSLVSPGTQRDDALYHDSSADGRTVFFTTASRLIPELDRNASSDLYAARIGGGFPLPIAPSRCAGEGCQAPTPPPPSSPAPASTEFHGPGDEAEPAPPLARHRVQRLTRRQLRAFARHGRTSLRVRVNAPGTVRVIARARMGRRTRTVARTRRAVLRGATVRLPLVLSRAARRQLRRGGRLRIAISVTYSESDTTIVRRVVLRG